MPFYTYRCQGCGEVQQELRKVDQRAEPLICKCGDEAVFEITATQIAAVRGGGSGSGFSKVVNTPPK